MAQADDKIITTESEPENPRHRVTIIRRPPSAEEEAEASKSKRSQQITFTELKRIFVDGVGNRQIPSDAVLHDMVDQLNSKWVDGYKNGLWEFRNAIGVILDDGPAVIQAHKRLRSQQAKERVAAYTKLLRAAQEIACNNVLIPQLDEPPKARHAKVVANLYHRDWRVVFDAVRAALKSAEWKKIGEGHESPAVTISCKILKELGITATPDALAKMLARRRAAKPEKRDKAP